MKRNKQLLIKLNESENDIVQNMRLDGINISQYVRNVITEYSDALDSKCNIDMSNMSLSGYKY